VALLLYFAVVLLARRLKAMTEEYERDCNPHGRFAIRLFVSGSLTLLGPVNCLLNLVCDKSATVRQKSARISSVRGRWPPGEVLKMLLIT
jgi:hypothetical protein